MIFEYINKIFRNKKSSVFFFFKLHKVKNKCLRSLFNNLQTICKQFALWTDYRLKVESNSNSLTNSS